MQTWLGTAVVVMLSTAHAGGLEGTYTLQGHSGVLVTRVEVKGHVLQGVIQVPDGAAVKLKGIARHNEGRGIARSPHGNGQFKAVLSGDELQIVISQPGRPGQQPVDLPLRFIRLQ